MVCSVADEFAKFIILGIARHNKDQPDFEENDAFHAQFESQYDPRHNAIYNVNREPEPDTVPGHRRTTSQLQGHEMMPAQGMQIPLGNGAPFGPRPTPDQLPPYSSRVNSPEPRMNQPPVMLQPGGSRHGERRSLGGRTSEGSSDGMKASRMSSGQ